MHSLVWSCSSAFLFFSLSEGTVGEIQFQRGFNGREWGGGGVVVTYADLYNSHGGACWDEVTRLAEPCLKGPLLCCFIAGSCFSPRAVVGGGHFSQLVIHISKTEHFALFSACCKNLMGGGVLKSFFCIYKKWRKKEMGCKIRDSVMFELRFVA